MANNTPLPLQHTVILILSPQAWGAMFISKHHYALELARKGNTVYFLNPPEQNKGKSFISIAPVPHEAGLFIISYRPWFPYFLKFHALPVFQWLMHLQVKKIVQKIGTPVNIVWSFDLGWLYPFRYFPKGMLKIFHPVDEPLDLPALRAADGAHIIFSVTREIIEKYKNFNVPAFLINHGVSQNFLHVPATNYQPSNPIHVGISGNFLRPDIDRDILLQIIQENPGVCFDCWGSYQAGHANIGGGADEKTLQFISRLQQLPNVVLHGAVASEKLAGELQKADAFLICYDINKDQSKGTNYHKIMEYLATGKVIVSNNVTAYQGMTNLVQMTAERNSNAALPQLFSQVINNLDYHNNTALQNGRYQFAEENTYKKQVEKIEGLLSSLLPQTLFSLQHP